jgi:HAD superfamily hydrolase (TIGR01509 family)
VLPDQDVELPGDAARADDATRAHDGPRAEDATRTDGATRARQAWQDPLAAVPDPGALVLDLDGTLVDTVEARIGGWLQTFEEIGLAADPRQVAELIGSDGKRLARVVAESAGHVMTDEQAEEVDRRAGELYDVLNHDPRPLPGARPLLVALSASELPWAIATSSRAQQVLGSVDALRLPQRPHIVDGSHVRHAKPAPDLLLLAAEQLGAPPEGCWYVGDATWDMRAASAAGMVGIGVTTGAVDAAALESAGAAVALPSLTELVAELEQRGCIPRGVSAG